MGDALRAQEYLSASRTAAFVSFQLGRREILLLTVGPAGMGCLVSESRNRSVPGYADVAGNASEFMPNRQLTHRTVRTRDFPDFGVLGGSRANRPLLPVAPPGVAIRPAERLCPAALKSRIGGPYSSALSVISLQSHCTEITEVCTQILDDVHDKFRT